MSTTYTPAREQRRRRAARTEPMSAREIAPDMFRVRNLRGCGGRSTYVVDVRGEACECEDFQYRMGPVDGRCKHLWCAILTADGVLCPSCGYAMCRPSCPERGR